MDNLELIESLKQALPPTVAVIGYGSGIYRQTGYKTNDIPDKDVIIVVEDFKDFLISDYEQNPQHFSEDFDKHILERKKEKERFYSNIGCLKFYHENAHFKAMIISQKALSFDIETWKYFGMAGRLTKPILYSTLPEDLELAIQENRKNILITALLLNKNHIMTKSELYNTISKITYMYDFRTVLPAEKRTKSSDIVNGAYNFFEEIYDTSAIENQTGEIINPHPILSITNLPVNLQKYLEKYINENKDEATLEEISRAINNYFRKTNFPNSIMLALSSSTTLGPKETVKHALTKVKRHFQH